ncbi:hypothetical protein NQ176_g3910 [Zarea fungicola]|uniref:Uncharacterized protein n=1 Tax=Zarea fungicola TaxID=93591 RepID=A0ACC1NGT7_9HYPO|nr:hypothetical protein NQ176_g3910 [Lecanicillium fungicola]
MKIFSATVSIVTSAITAIAIPTPAAASSNLVPRDAACGVHFVVFKTENCGGLSCTVNSALGIHLQIFSPDTSGHQLIASRGGDLGSNFDLGSFFFQNKFQNLLLVTSKNTPDPNDYTLHFAFGGDQWLSSDPRCKVGKYDGESEMIQGDCSFTCT